MSATGRIVTATVIVRGLALAGALVAATAAVATAEPKAALGVPAGPTEPTIRAAWRAWIKTAAWLEAAAPEPVFVTACLATEPTCADGLIRLGADRSWILALTPPATPGAEPFLVGRVYDRGGALLASGQRACARCASNKPNLTAEVGKLLDTLRDAVEKQTTRLVITTPAGGPALFLDGAPLEAAAPGQPLDRAVGSGPHLITATGACWALEPVSVVVGSGETVHATIEPTRQTPRLRIRTWPAGTRIAVDGVEAGVTTDAPLEVATGPGPHRITATHDGWRAGAREVTSAACDTQDVELVLLRRSGRGRTPYLVAGGAGVAIVGGLALILLDREQTDGGVRSATYRDSAPLGAVVTGLGLAGAGVAVYLFLREPPLVPAITPTAGGAIGGAAWTF